MISQEMVEPVRREIRFPVWTTISWKRTARRRQPLSWAAPTGAGHRVVARRRSGGAGYIGTVTSGLATPEASTDCTWNCLISVFRVDVVADRVRDSEFALVP